MLFSIAVTLLFLSFFASVVLTGYFRNIARANKFLIDIPDKSRKFHFRPTPLIGGLSIHASMLLSSMFMLFLIDYKYDFQFDGFSLQKHNQSEVVSVVGDLKNKHVLIIDDMIDTAGTISNAAKVAKEKGALSVTVAATHGILSSNALDKLSDDIIHSIFITDTIDMSHIDNCKKLKIISSANIFAETINRIHSGESVSQLFRKVT